MKGGSAVACAPHRDGIGVARRVVERLWSVDGCPAILITSMRTEASAWNDSDDDEEDCRRQRRLHDLAAAMQQRRRIAVLLHQQQRQPQQSHRKSAAFDWNQHMLRLTPDEFRARYRLDADAFYKLLQLVAADLEITDKVRACTKREGSAVCPATRLAVCLRFLAGGQVLDLKLIYQMSRFSIYACVWKGISAINKRLHIKFPIDDIAALEELERDFRAKSPYGVWAGQVGCIDGVHFSMLNPGAAVDNPKRYFVARKNEFAILCIAICDAKRRFTYYDMNKAPTTHDSMAWASSPLGVKFANGELPQPFFINGDAAFSLSNSLITPSGLKELDAFDFEQSSQRMPIECAFGILVRRWGILWRDLEVRFDRRTLLIAVCMKLHNFCIDNNVPLHENVATDQASGYRE
eukprot:5796127-Pleurochrysis_carterae.AAC.1